MLFLKVICCFATLVFVAPSVSTEALPCKVPVFRYALEHWLPDSYELMVLHRGALSEDGKALVSKLKEKAGDPNGGANLRVLTVDVQQIGEFKLLTQVLGSGFEETIVTPEIVLLFPANSDNGPLAWRGPLTSENVDALLESPARRQITEWILDGESVVWVLMPVGDAEKDQAAERLFRSEIPRLEKAIEMRDIEVIESEKKFGKDTKVKLRLGIKLLVLDRNDPREKIFAATLLRSEKDLEELDAPFAVPVFGRGRAYLSLAGKGINPGMIEATCRFLIGDCSCEVKRLNPGVDLLFAVNWDEAIGGNAEPDKPRLEAADVGLYIDVPPGNSTTAKHKSDVNTPLPVTDAVVVNATSIGLLSTVLIAALVVLAVVVIGFTARQLS